MSFSHLSEGRAPRRLQKSRAGLHALTCTGLPRDPSQGTWIISVPGEWAGRDPASTYYPTKIFGGIDLTGRSELALTFTNESDAREAGYLLRDDEDMFDAFEAVCLNGRSNEGAPA